MANKTELLNRLKRNTDNKFFVDLIAYIDFRLAVIKEQLIDCTDDFEFKRLQGRGKELTELRSSLTRKPIEKQFTGAFN